MPVTLLVPSCELHMQPVLGAVFLVDQECPARSGRPVDINI